MSASSNDTAVFSDNRALNEFLTTEQTLSINCNALTNAILGYLEANKSKQHNGLSSEDDYLAVTNLLSFLHEVATGFGIWRDTFKDKNSNLEILTSINRTLEAKDAALLRYLGAAGLFGVLLPMYKSVILKIKNKDFHQYIDQHLRAAEHECTQRSGGTLSILANPVQRICRFGILFEAVVKNIKNDQVDAILENDAASSILRKFKRITDTVNRFNSLSTEGLSIQTVLDSCNILLDTFEKETTQAIERTVFIPHDSATENLLNELKVCMDVLNRIDVENNQEPRINQHDTHSHAATSRPVSPASTKSKNSGDGGNSTQAAVKPDSSTASPSQDGLSTNNHMDLVLAAPRSYNVNINNYTDKLIKTQYNLHFFGGTTEAGGKKVPANVADMLTTAYTKDDSLTQLQKMAAISVKARFNRGCTRKNSTQDLYEDALEDLGVDSCRTQNEILGKIEEEWGDNVNEMPRTVARIYTLLKNKTHATVSHDDIAEVIHLAQEAASSWKQYLPFYGRSEETQTFYETITSYLVFTPLSARTDNDNENDGAFMHANTL